MSEERSPDDQPTDFDWESPRWREAAGEAQGKTEREHRFRDDGARRERGAIDRGGSVGRGRQPEQPADADPPRDDGEDA